MITYKITSTHFDVNPDGTQGQINLVVWFASSSDGTVTATIGQRGTVIPVDYPPAMKPYADVTEQDCIDWVTDLEDQASIQAQLDVVIASYATPQEGSGLPWQADYPLWAVGVAVVPGDVRIYQGAGYECIQGHTTQTDWAPPATPALWTPYVPAGQGPQPWVQPTGSQDAYALGAQVTHTGNLWISLVDANVWEPTTANSTLWQDEGAYP